MPNALLFAASESGVESPAQHEPGRLRHRHHLFRHGVGDRLLPEEVCRHRRRLFHGGPQNDRLDRRPELHFGQSQLAGNDGLVGDGLSVRHVGGPRLSDQRRVADPVPGRGDDAVLLHLQDAFRAGLSEAPLRRVEPLDGRNHICRDDRSWSADRACSPWRRF